MTTRVTLIAGVGVVALAGAAAFVSWPSAPDVPVVRVERADFVRSVGAEGTLRAVQATPITTAVDIDDPLKVAWLAADGTPVKAGDVVVRFDPNQLEEDLVRGQSDRSSADRKISKAEAARSATGHNLERDAALAVKELDTARQFQSRDSDIYSRYEIITSEIDAELAGRRKEYADAVRGTRDGIAEAELGLLAIDGRKADLAVDKARRGLGAIALTAPHDGIVVFRRDWRGNLPRVGDTCWAGQKLAEIPRLDVMEAEVSVLEADAGGLAAGQRATVMVEGRPEATFEAAVKQVDALAKPRFRNVPVQYFGAVLTLARTDPEIMKPGQRVQARIVLAEAKGALVVPRQAVFEKDGRKIVHRRQRWGSFETREVTLGATALGRVVIEAGLAEGDLVAVVDPASVRADRPRATPAGPAVGGSP